MPADSPEHNDPWKHALQVTRPALVLAPRNFIDEVRSRLTAAGVVAAVAARDPAPLFDWTVKLLARQGISNRATEVFAERHGSATWAEVSARMAADARCPRLGSYWRFVDCRYRRSTGTCGTPHHLVGCPVTMIPARKGTLAEAAVGLWLFIRDIAGGDLVGWIDARLTRADLGPDHPARGAAMRDAVLHPLLGLTGTGHKIWSMVLAELLLGADSGRDRWVTTGASFIAVDSLVHAYLKRTGILRRLDADHAYGTACTSIGGCVEVLSRLATHIDAREFNTRFPPVFPRWVQFAIWHFCATGGSNICNAMQIDDHAGCQQHFCPGFHNCDRLALQERI